MHQSFIMEVPHELGQVFFPFGQVKTCAAQHQGIFIQVFHNYNVPHSRYSPVTEEPWRVAPLSAKVVKFRAIAAGELYENHAVTPATLVDEPVLIHLLLAL